MADRAARTWSWVVDACLVLYAGYLAYVLSVRGPLFSGIFADFNVQQRASTATVVRFCTPVYLYAFVGVLALVLVVKNQIVTNDIIRLRLSFLVLVLVLLSNTVANEAFFQPMIRLFQAVNTTR